MMNLPLTSLLPTPSNFVQLTRLNKPIGITLALIPALHSVIYFSPQLTYSNLAYVTCLLVYGAITMRSLGCVVNDYLDVRFDRQVARTHNRPYASGSITRPQLITTLVLLSLLNIPLIVLIPTSTFLMGCLIALLAGLYPLAKRFLPIPQLVLGLVFNLGLLFSAHLIITRYELLGMSVTDLPLLLNYAGFVLLTLAYDTIYGFQDIADDRKLPIGNFALLIEKQPKWLLIPIYSMSLMCFFVSFFLQQFNGIGLVVFGLILLYLSVLIDQWQPKSPSSSLKIFKDHQWVLLMLLGLQLTATLNQWVLW